MQYFDLNTMLTPAERRAAFYLGSAPQIVEQVLTPAVMTRIICTLGEAIDPEFIAYAIEFWINDALEEAAYYAIINDRVQ